MENDRVEILSDAPTPIRRAALFGATTIIYGSVVTVSISNLSAGMLVGVFGGTLTLLLFILLDLV